MMEQITQYLVNFLNVIQGLRKTAVMFGLMAIAVVLRIKGYMDGTNVSDLLKGTAVAFFAANGLEHVTTTVKTYINSKGKIKDESIVNVE